MSGLGRLLIIAGVLLVLVGVAVVFADRLPIRLGRLPGDIIWKGKNTTFYFPITTLVLLNLLLFVIFRFFNRS